MEHRLEWEHYGGRSSVGRAPDCGSGGRGFKSHRSPHCFLLPVSVMVAGNPVWEYAMVGGMLLLLVSGWLCYLMTVLRLNRHFEEMDHRLSNRFQTHWTTLNPEMRLLSQRMDAISQHHGQLVGDMNRLMDMSDARWHRFSESTDQKWLGLTQHTQSVLQHIQEILTEKLDHHMAQRLGSVYDNVATRLDDMHRGLGEMKALAQQVGDIKRVLTNVKQRGIWGEVQLTQLVSQVMAPHQYALQVPISDQGVVDLAIRLPGTQDLPLYLPIDSKFPLEPFQRIQHAHETGDTVLLQTARHALDKQVITEAIRMQSYINPPQTTDFAILFIPIESMYLELIQRPGMGDTLQTKYRIVLAGPSTLSALIGSLQLGFKTLAIQERSAEAWQTVGLLQREFAVFGSLLEKAQKKLSEAGSSLDDATRKTRRIHRTLDQLSSSVNHQHTQGDTPLCLDHSSPPL